MLTRTRALGVPFAALGIVALGAALAQASAMVEPHEGLSLEAEGAAAAPLGSVARVRCSSRPGERQHCAADTSHGVTLATSTGEAPCLLGRSWGYDDHGIWVSDGCTGEFIAAAARPSPEGKAGEAAPQDRKRRPEYIPNRGFRIYDGEHGQIYLRLFTYVRYLNQNGLDAGYTDYFGNPHDVKLRQDVQLNKFFLPFSGWFLDPRFNYYLYVWSSNPSQGDPAQVVGAGNISFTFNRYATLGGGIGCLNTTRSTEGQFPYWLGVDNRMTADEFFRGSDTTGFWLKGQAAAGLNDMAMLANNLSTLGVSASQLDNDLNTTALSLVWMPTTKEFGFMSEFGDFEAHEKMATRLGGISPTAARKSRARRTPTQSKTARSDSPTGASSSRAISSGRTSPSTK